MAEHGFGMIGCGMIAEFHTRAIAEIPGARVVAVYDTVAPKAARIAELAGGGCRAYDNLEAMLAHPVLIQRPFVIAPGGVRLCRPPERVREILAGG